MPRNVARELKIAPFVEGGLILACAALGFAIHQPLVFASLGPTAYEMVETPKQKSSTPYNVIVGHAVGIGAGFAALAMTGAWFAPQVSVAAGVPASRMWAAAIAAALTVAVNLVLKAGQPAAVATALLIASGPMQQPRAALSIFLAVVIIVILGEPMRRARLRNYPPEEDRVPVPPPPQQRVA